MPAWNQILDEIKEEHETRPTVFDKVRRNYLRELSNYTGREIILYSSGWTELNFDSRDFSITDSDIHGMMQTIHDFDGEELDIILHSPGGPPVVAEQIVNYLRSKFEDIRVIVPQSALSAATLICCASDEVIMAHHSSLGPTDPQLRILTKQGYQWVPAQTIVDQFDEVEEKASTGENISHYGPILEKYDPSLLNKAREAISLSRRLAEEWSRKYMFSTDSDRDMKAEQLADYLSDRSNFLSHNRRLGKHRLVNDTDMKITQLENDQDLQEYVLSVFHATIATHSHQNIVKIIENQHGSLYSRNA